MFKNILLKSIIIFIFSSLLHSLYNYLPMFITSIVVPVNESIAEHMKMIFSAYILFILVIFAFKKQNNYNYITFNTIEAILNIIIFLIIYLPINKLVGEIMVLTLVIYFISIFITNLISIKIEKKEISKNINLLMILIIVIIYSLFAILTYYPPKIALFYDKQENIYGIKSLNK